MILFCETDSSSGKIVQNNKSGQVSLFCTANRFASIEESFTISTIHDTSFFPFLIWIWILAITKFHNVNKNDDSP